MERGIFEKKEPVKKRIKFADQQMDTTNRPTLASQWGRLFLIRYPLSHAISSLWTSCLSTTFQIGIMKTQVHANCQSFSNPATLKAFLLPQGLGLTGPHRPTSHRQTRITSFVRPPHCCPSLSRRGGNLGHEAAAALEGRRFTARSGPRGRRRGCGGGSSPLRLSPPRPDVDQYKHCDSRNCAYGQPNCCNHSPSRQCLGRGRWDESSDPG